MVRWILAAALMSTGVMTHQGSEPANTVLVLDSGQAMLVQSYRIDSGLIHIVGAEGEPLIMRADRVDLEASRTATAKHREHAGRSEADHQQPENTQGRGAALMHARNRSLSLLEASRDALERGTNGAFSTAGTTHHPTRATEEAERSVLTQGSEGPESDEPGDLQSLRPGERKPFSFPADEPLTVSVETTLSPEQAESCNNHCVRLSSKDDTRSVAAPRNAGLELEPEEGLVAGWIENVEDFTIEVRLHAK